MSQHSDHQRILFSAAPRFYRFAVQELRRALPVHRHKAVGEDAGIITLDGADLPVVVQACQDNSVRFVRHLAAVGGDVATGEARSDPMPHISSLVEELDLDDPAAPLALQVWTSGKAPASAESVRVTVADHLRDRGHDVQRSGCPRVLSVCVGEKRIVVGITDVAESLCDWPGGRFRLADSPQRISRAEFKLEELFALLPLTIDGPALDLGASPGGWSRILLEHGAAPVHGVDPGEPDASIARHPDLVWHRTTAGNFLERTEDHFSVIVNDMRMEPLQSARTMIMAADHQRSGDVAIVTLKLTPDHAVDQADEAIDLLARRYRVIFARQLHHNRNEMTVVGRRR